MIRLADLYRIELDRIERMMGLYGWVLLSLCEHDGKVEVVFLKTVRDVSEVDQNNYWIPVQIIFSDFGWEILDQNIESGRYTVRACKSLESYVGVTESEVQ